MFRRAERTCSSCPLSSLRVQRIAGAFSFSSFRRASADTLKKSLSPTETSWILLLRRAVCSFALSSAHPAMAFSSLFLGITVPKFQAKTLSGRVVVFLLFVGLTTFPLVSFRKSCTQDLESCRPCPHRREIDTLRLGTSIVACIF